MLFRSDLGQHTVELVDTVGLHESLEGTVPADQAALALVDLLQSAREGFHLMIHVSRAGRLTRQHEQDHELFVEQLTQHRVPCLLVVTGCENEEPMTQWVEQNRASFERFGYAGIVATCFGRGGPLESHFAPLRQASREAVLAALARHALPEPALVYGGSTAITFNEALSAIDMTIDGARWMCTLADYGCRTPELPPPGEIRRGITGPVRGDISRITPRPRVSPDGKWVAFIDNFNVAIRPASPAKPAEKRIALSSDGSEGHYYDGTSLVWSPDSTKLAAYRVRPGYRRLVHYVYSSPEDQLQPEHWASQYAKPGDELDLEQPVLFDVASKKATLVDARLFPNPYEDRKSTRLNSSHSQQSRMPSSA